MRKIIGENIRRARIMKKQSISELSSRAKIPEYKIKKFESGDEFQSIKDLAKISRSLGISLDFLFEKQESVNLIRLRKNKMTERDRIAAIEMTRYKSRGPVSLMKMFKMDIFQPIPFREFDDKEAYVIGKSVAKEWSDGSSLSLILENHGIILIQIPSETSLFRGLFMVNRGVPIISVNKMRENDKEILEDIAHELGHAIFMKQKLSEEQEEIFCDLFAKGFSEEFLKTNGFNLGDFNFLERKTREAWLDEKITTSRGAELLEVDLKTFSERMKNEG